MSLYFILSFISYILFFIQYSVLEGIFLFAYYIDIPLVFVLYSVMRYGGIYGVSIGFNLGCLYDLLLGKVFGINIFLYMFWGLVPGVSHNSFIYYSSFYIYIIVAIACILNNLMYFFIFDLIFPNLNSWNIFFVNKYSLLIFGPLLSASFALVLFRVLDYFLISDTFKDFN